MRRTEKNGTVDSVRRTYKLCCYSNTFNCCHSVFACYEGTIAVHSVNSLMVSNLTTGNSGQLKMSAKFRPSQKQRFWIWPTSTNVGRKFLYHIDKNEIIIQKSENNTIRSAKSCNCRKPNKCPLMGNCLVKSIVYKGTVTTDNDSKSYVWLCETDIKSRWNNHKCSFKHKLYYYCGQIYCINGSQLAKMKKLIFYMALP